VWPGASRRRRYLRLVDQKRIVWQSEAQFFGVAAEMMRRILVGRARGPAGPAVGVARPLDLDVPDQGRLVQPSLALGASCASFGEMAISADGSPAALGPRRPESWTVPISVPVSAWDSAGRGTRSVGT
jgi:hypothetical protein